MSFSKAPRPVSAGRSSQVKKGGGVAVHRGSASSAARSSSSGPAGAPPATGVGANRARISESRFDVAKPVDLFGQSEGGGTPFQNAYTRRELPCVLSHGSVNHRLEWKTSPEDVDYDRVLRILAAGLTETRHPYYFVAAKGFQDLCEAPGAGPKAAPLARIVSESIRKCLISDSPKVYEAGLLALEQYARAVRSELTPHLKLVIGQISKKMTLGKMRDRLTEVLNTLEECCGIECFKLIKSKIPVYHSVNFGNGGASGLRL